MSSLSPRLITEGSLMEKPLRIALLSYRGKKHCGGQGVYVRHLSKALVDMGHHVEVFGGNPYPDLDSRVPLHKLPSLDVYNDHFPGRMPGFWEIKSFADFAEVSSFSMGTFSEPLAFSIRAYQALRNRVDDFDIVQDNQTLGYGILALERVGLPVLGTIHHPITVDRRLEIEHARTLFERVGKRRWYAFTKMQTRVAKRLSRVITVSENSLKDIHADHQVPLDRMHVVPVGVDPELFLPMPDVKRIPGRVVTTASADVALKGLRYLLEAIAKLRTERSDVHLVVIGKAKEGGQSEATIRELGLEGHVDFVSGVPDERIVELYSESELAVVPSLYEGFSLPAIEAMSCGIPLIATTGGALPEVTGTDYDTVLHVEPGDADALAAKMSEAFDDPDLRARIGARGRKRVVDYWSWSHTAVKTVEHYRALLAEWPDQAHQLKVR
jgi:glycosyltransferase involved in cell wall biosynthesis